MVVSWEADKDRVAKEFAPITELAENIPTDLVDRLNALPLSARRAGDMQVHVFEAEIESNTAADEPYAPPIRIINEVDDEPTPPLEFYYSNKMWHGEGVPKPDPDTLQGCGCRGPCKPGSRCSCIRRQKEMMALGEGGIFTRFIYDLDGRLMQDGEDYPIVECNMFCGCPEDCPNRVIQPRLLKWPAC